MLRLWRSLSICFNNTVSTIPALIISGVYQLSQGLNKSPTLSGDQAVKFANYFVSRRSVTTAKGAYHLLNVAKIFSSNKVVITIDLHEGTTGKVFCFTLNQNFTGKQKQSLQLD